MGSRYPMSAARQGSTDGGTTFPSALASAPLTSSGSSIFQVGQQLLGGDRQIQGGSMLAPEPPCAPRPNYLAQINS